MPDPGSEFAGWSSACTGTGTCSFVVSAYTAVYALFRLAPAPAAPLDPPYDPSLASALEAPTPAPVADVAVKAPRNSATVDLEWSAVASADPVQYRVILGRDATFSGPLVGDSGWIAGMATAIAITGLPNTCYDPWPATYYWSVIARDPASNVVSAWSPASTFGAYTFQPWEC